MTGRSLLRRPCDTPRASPGGFLLLAVARPAGGGRSAAPRPAARDSRSKCSRPSAPAPRSSPPKGSGRSRRGGSRGGAQRWPEQRVAAAARLRDAEQRRPQAAYRMAALARRARRRQRRQSQPGPQPCAAAAADRASVALSRPETLLAVPAPPEDAFRGVAVLQGICTRARARRPRLSARAGRARGGERRFGGSAELPPAEAAQAARAQLRSSSGRSRPAQADRREAEDEADERRPPRRGRAAQAG